MKTRKELIYLNIKDLTQKEIEGLGDLSLNCCDKCGEIDDSERLLDNGEIDIPELSKKINDETRTKYVSLCDTCLDEIKNK